MRERQRTLREIREGRLSSSITTYGLSEKPPAPAPFVEPKMLRVSQVAETLGVSRQSVIRWFGDRAVVVPNRKRRVILIPREALAEWIEKHRAG